MATPTSDLDFYSQYSEHEIEKFESILRLIHADEPNLALAKKMVTDFKDTNELERFKSFKQNFENALQNASQNIDQYSDAINKLKSDEVDLEKKQRELLNSYAQKVGSDLKDQPSLDSGNTRKKPN
jgi:hypothetical protein